MSYKQYELEEKPTGIPAINETGDANTLRRGTLQSMNYVKNQKGWRLNESGLAEFLDADVGGRLVTISSVNDLQGAINELVSVGGGKVFLKAGTYNITTVIVGDSSVSIEGASASSTILKFGSTSANISFAGTSIYTTGTITVASGVNITGSGTSWLANVTTSHQLFLGTRWYKIAAVTSDTTLVLAEGYGDNVTLPSTYRIAIPKIDINFKEITLQSSTGTGLVFTDCRNIELDNLNIIQNNVGFAMTNVSEVTFREVTIASSTSDGYQITNAGFLNAYGLASIGNGGNGATLNNLKPASFLVSACDANTGDGFHCTSVVNTTFNVEASGNGGQGIEFVSGCNSNSLTSLVTGNTSDGIKLTATSDGNIITAGSITFNGGYGINISAATCDNNTVIGPYLASNTSGSVNDSGTGTISIRASDFASTAGFAGDGSDGTVTITGGTTTLTRDMFYNDLTISGTGVLKPAGFRVFVKGTLTIASGGVIQRNGNAGTDGDTSVPGPGGAGLASGSLPGSSAGGNGGLSSAGGGFPGGAGVDVAKGLGSAGAAGGAGGTSGGAGGIAGAKTGTVFNTPRSVASAYSLIDSQPSNTPASLTGSASSGGGGGAGSFSGDNGEGGGGGSPGGVLVIFAKAIVNSGTISANGGAGGKGGDGSGAGAGGAGGGGGGSGGVVILVYSTFSGNAVTVTAGAAGAKGIGVAPGADGTAGTIGNAGVVYTISA